MKPLVAAVLGLLVAGPGKAAGQAAPTFAGFVDRYLNDFATRHPSIAAGNGIHSHDDRLEDFSAAAIRGEVAALKRDRIRLAAFRDAALTVDERVDRRILAGIIDGWLLEQETLQNWRRNPMLYASAITDGVHDLMTMQSDAPSVRMRRIISKLRQVPALLAAARSNVRHPPKLFLERGASMMHAASDMLGHDLLLAFATEPRGALRDSLGAAANVARLQLAEYADFLERDIAPHATGDFAIGGVNVARRYAAEELLDIPLDDMVAIGSRELTRQQKEFRTVAEHIAPGRDAQETWHALRRDHPKRGEVVAATQRIVDSLAAFVEQHGIAALPPGEHVVVATALPFDLGFASMHASPPLERRPLRSVFYISDTRPDPGPGDDEAWLERFNYASLANTAAHEAIPGHWLHSTYMRRTPGKIRRIWIGLNPFPQPSSGQDGWAHYAEQMVLDEGFSGGNGPQRLAQISDALTRICRLLAGIKLHTKAWTLDDAQRCFEREAYVPAAAARREAERGTYDPTYGGYFLGKMGIVKLRADYAAMRGSRFVLRDFHERFMTNGIAPIWAQRQLLLPGDTGAIIR